MCLNCRKNFLSKSIGNRVCKRCLNTTDYENLATVFRVSLNHQHSSETIFPKFATEDVPIVRKRERQA